MKKILTILLFVPLAAFGQQNKAAAADSQAAIDAAMAKAREQQSKPGEIARGQKRLDEAVRGGQALRKNEEKHRPRGITYDELRKQQQGFGVDPMEVAERYKQLQRATKPEAEDLYVFVSLSMPMDTLKALGAQTAKAGGIMVFRGIKGGIAKGNWQKWLTAVKPIAETGVTINIDPELFTAHQVRSVPMFVLRYRPEGCNIASQCATQDEEVIGDVTLDYALEHMTGNNRTGRMAERYLAKLKPR